MTDPLSEWLDAMSAKARAATPGPWRQLGDMAVNTSQAHPLLTLSAPFHRMRSDGKPGKDAAYLAALDPDTVGALVECVRALANHTHCDDPGYCGRPPCPSLTCESCKAREGALAHLRRLAKGDAK